MAIIELDGRIAHKRDTDAALSQSGFIPMDGEIVLAEIDGEVRIKAGDGQRTYAQLPFLDATLREDIAGKADANHTHAVVTESAGGFMSPTDKMKLDGIFQWKINPLTPAGQGSVTAPRNTTAYFGEYAVEQSGLYYLWYQTWAQPGEYNKTFVLFLDSAENGEMAVRGEATSNVTVMCVAGVFSLSAGDTIKGRIFHNCTDTQSVGTKFGVLLLTAA